LFFVLALRRVVAQRSVQVSLETDQDGSRRLRIQELMDRLRRAGNEALALFCAQQVAYAKQERPGRQLRIDRQAGFEGVQRRQGSHFASPISACCFQSLTDAEGCLVNLNAAPGLRIGQARQ